MHYQFWKSLTRRLKKLKLSWRHAVSIARTDVITCSNETKMRPAADRELLEQENILLYERIRQLSKQNKRLRRVKLDIVDEINVDGNGVHSVSREELSLASELSQEEKMLGKVYSNGNMVYVHGYGWTDRREAKGQINMVLDKYGGRRSGNKDLSKCGTRQVIGQHAGLACDRLMWEETLPLE